MHTFMCPIYVYVWKVNKNKQQTTREYKGYRGLGVVPT